MESDIRALAFDTGGTLLDWHGGLTAAFTRVGAQKKIDRDWPLLTNEYRRRSLNTMLNAVHPNFNIDDVNREELDRLLRAENLSFDDQDTQLVIPGINWTLGQTFARGCCSLEKSTSLSR